MAGKNTDELSTTSSSEMRFVLVISIVSAIVCLITFFVLYRRRIIKKANEKKENAKKCIYPYLQQFDVDDIDLRRAPTGGWHGTYLNKLAYGVNRQENRIKNQNIGRSTGDISHGSGSTEDMFHTAHEDDDDIYGNTDRGGVDDDWMKTRLTRLGSSRKVMDSLLNDYQGVPSNDNQSFPEKAVIGFV